MKKMILGLLILFFAAVAWAQEKVEAPVWNIGDRWTFKRQDGIIWTFRVVDVKEEK